MKSVKPLLVGAAAFLFLTYGLCVTAGAVTVAQGSNCNLSVCGNGSTIPDGP